MDQDDLKEFRLPQKEAIEVDKWYLGEKLAREPGQEFGLNWIVEHGKEFRDNWQEFAD